MKHIIQFIRAKHYFLVTTFGELTSSGSMAIFDDLFNIQDWQTGLPILVDHRNASFQQLSLEEIEDFSIYLREKNTFLGHAKMAIIMSPKQQLSKYAMWKIITEPEVLFSIDTFSSVEEAEEWFSHANK